jgi:hypothetical protein
MRLAHIHIEMNRRTPVSIEIEIAADAVKYLSYVFDDFSSRYSMSEYIPAVYWAVDSGTTNEHGDFALSGQAGYCAVLVKISEAAQDLRLSVTPEKIFALRLDPKLNGKSHLNISVTDEKITIV